MTRKSSATPSPLASGFSRTHVVWASLLAAMTGAAGLLSALEGGGSVERRGAGSPRPLAALAGSSEARGLEAVFQTKAEVETGHWQSIVIHHSGDVCGSAESITRDHTAKGLRGLGYHFVISNGQGASDGQIHVGFRWSEQLAGAHTTGPQADLYNRTGIGICLVGDGERREFTDEQISRLVELVAELQQRLGIPDENVRLHRDLAGTAAPGRLFPEAEFRTRVAQMLGR